MKSSFSSLLLKWNRDKNDRKMPWKGEKDPYKIWLSEIILQQTRVEQGWAYYERFVKKYPTVKKLANAPEKEVFKLWEGLGYYSRCKNLLETARIIANKYKGKFPDTYDEIRALKGIGPYTAAAIGSFAFNLPYAVVDGNVQRVIARYFGLTTPIDTTAGKKLFSELATALLPVDKAGLYNQAIMDFGATICKPQNPLCSECIQRKECQAYRLDQVKNLPVKEKSITRKERWLYYFVIEDANQVLIRLRTSKDIWQNLYEFVLYESTSTIESPESLLKQLLPGIGYTVQSISRLYRQQLTHQQVNGCFIRVSVRQVPDVPGGYEKIKRGQLHEYAFPRLINQFLQESDDRSFPRSK